MKKVLIVASVASMIDQFNKGNIETLISMNCEVHVATNFNNPGNISFDRMEKLKKYLTSKNVKYFQIDFSRGVYNISKNFSSFKQLKKVIDSNDYDLIHTQSPVGGVITRLISKKAKIPVIYTAHGFHFYQGAPKRNWLVFYPIEKYLSKYTDLLITINHEDYNYSKEKLDAKKTVYLPGIGVNLSEFSSNTRDYNRNDISEVKLLSIGELNKNKNHKVIFFVLKKLLDEGFKVRYTICGDGILKKEYLELIKQLDISDFVELVGYTENIKSYLSESDIFVFPSIREGLPVSVIEALGSGLPVVAAANRGTRDLIIEEKGGYLIDDPFDIEAFYEKIKVLIVDKSKEKEMGVFNKVESEKYSDLNVNLLMKNFYNNF